MSSSMIMVRSLFRRRGGQRLLLIIVPWKEEYLDNRRVTQVYGTLAELLTVLGE